MFRVSQENKHVNAFCDLYIDEAIRHADALDEEIIKGGYRGRLHGIPVALKDLTPLLGKKLTYGSRLFLNNVSYKDAIIADRLKKAGAIIIGKTNTPEFGHKGVTDNLIFGATNNPHDLRKVAGGSSGGSAAAVSSCMVPLAEGSDGAGSIRIPAALCGVVGFKPTYGRIPDVAGPFSSMTPFFHNGPLAKAVYDCHFFMKLSQGYIHTILSLFPYTMSLSGTIHLKA